MTKKKRAIATAGKPAAKDGIRRLNETDRRKLFLLVIKQRKSSEALEHAKNNVSRAEITLLTDNQELKEFTERLARSYKLYNVHLNEQTGVITQLEAKPTP